MQYELETLDSSDDNGTMPANVEELSGAIVGHRISTCYQKGASFYIVLDNGKTVTLHNTDDCCAYTDLNAFLLHPDKVDHVIMGVGTTDDYMTWHIYADAGDILELTVGWSAGNPFYYGYGFDITVTE